MSTALIGRVVLVVVLWPVIYVSDRLKGINPPASFREGLSWARRGHV